MRPALYTHSKWLAPHRATPDEAQTIARLADKAVALAREHGEVLTRKDAIARVRENLADVKRMAKEAKA